MTGSHELYIQTIREIVGEIEGKSLLDLCCGEMAVTQKMPFDWKRSLAVDVIDAPERPRICDFLLADARSFVPEQIYDVAICSDGIEHLSFTEGVRLLTMMHKYAKVAIVFTPTGDKNLDSERSTNPHSHKSSWSPMEFEVLDWNTHYFPDWHPTICLGAVFAWRKNFNL